MAPEDVPDDLIELFDKGSYERASAYAGHTQIDNEREYFRGGLAAVLPAHEAMVRAKVAAELHARADEGAPGTGFKRGLRAAAHHANPTTIEDAAKAVQAMYEQAKSAPAQTTAAHTARAEDERGR